jgi:hypothetical protein
MKFRELPCLTPTTFQLKLQGTEKKILLVAAIYGKSQK